MTSKPDPLPPAANAGNDQNVGTLHGASADGRWTEIELLPAWGEEFYDVYTAKKLGKWVMLKTLKPEFRNDPRFVEMINREFDARYNLSHPNIVMINDFEEVPGVGLSIICDDVYGLPLSKLLDDPSKFTDHHYEQLVTRLPMAMEYIQQNHLAHHPIRPETVIFTENIGNLKLIDVGFDQRKSLSHSDTNNDVETYGKLMQEVLRRTGRHDSRMARIADRAANGGYRDVQELQLALGGRRSRGLFIIGAFVIASLAVVLAWLLLHPTLQA